MYYIVICNFEIVGTETIYHTCESWPVYLDAIIFEYASVRRI